LFVARKAQFFTDDKNFSGGPDTARAVGEEATHSSRRANALRSDRATNFEVRRAHTAIDRASSPSRTIATAGRARRVDVRDSAAKIAVNPAFAADSCRASVRHDVTKPRFRLISAEFDQEWSVTDQSSGGVIPLPAFGFVGEFLLSSGFP